MSTTETPNAPKLRRPRITCAVCGGLPDARVHTFLAQALASTKHHGFVRDQEVSHG